MSTKFKVGELVRVRGPNSKPDDPPAVIASDGDKGADGCRAYEIALGDGRKITMPERYLTPLK